VTVTEKSHVWPGAIDAPLSEIELGLVNVTIPPPHKMALAFGTVSPTGSVSVNPTPVSVTGFAAGLVITKCNAVVPFRTTDAGSNDVTVVGGATTVSEADAAFPVPPSFDVIAPVVFV
jgi:hypothetical protein